MIDTTPDSTEQPLPFRGEESANAGSTNLSTAAWRGSRSLAERSAACETWKLFLLVATSCSLIGADGLRPPAMAGALGSNVRHRRSVLVLGDETQADSELAMLLRASARTEPRIPPVRGEGTNVVRLPRS